MIRYWTLAGLTAALILSVFFIAQALQVPLLHDPAEWMHGGTVAAVLGVGLLTVDVLFPVPASGIMLLNGAIFGVALGTLLSIAGALGAALVAFAIGRAGEQWITRVVTAEAHARAGRLLDRWGTLAIVISRPIPIIAETVMILAGASPLSWKRAGGAALAGSLVPAFLFALAGATAAGWANATLVFAGVLLVSALVWLVGTRRDLSMAPPAQESQRSAGGSQGAPEEVGEGRPPREVPASPAGRAG